MRCRDFVSATLETSVGLTMPVDSSMALPTGPEAAEEYATVVDASVERFEIRIAVNLIPMFDKPKQEMIHLIRHLRRNLAEFGIHMPLIRIRDWKSLQPDRYIVLINGDQVGRGMVRPHAILAVNMGNVARPYSSESSQEPIPWFRSTWIDQNERRRAKTNGYRIVRPHDLILSHLKQIVRGTSLP